MEINYGKRLKIVLFNPEIPANTGNIGRLCLGTNSELHIIKPMRFLLTDKYVKRAGLDYWHKVDLTLHDSWADFLNKYKNENLYFCETCGDTLYTDIRFSSGDFIIFGTESKGLPDYILNEFKNKVIKIPMSNDIRSINLCNSVAIVMYEALRQMM